MSNPTQELNPMAERSQDSVVSVVPSDSVEDPAEVLAVDPTVVDTVDVDLAVTDRFQKAMTPPENPKVNVDQETEEIVQTVLQDAADSDEDSEELHAEELAENVAHADQDHPAVVIIPTLKTKKTKQKSWTFIVTI